MNKQLIEQYVADAPRLAASIQGLSRQQLNAFPVPGTWSIQQIVLHVMDPAEAELAAAPEVRFRDPESAASVVVRPRELARAYRDTVRREIAAWRTTCRRHGILYHHVLTDLPFGMALRLLT